MLERILVPLDGSDLAARILIQVRRLLRRTDAEVILFRAYWTPLSLSRVDYSQLLHEDREEAQEYVARLAADLRGQGVRARELVAEGPPAEAILDAARAERAGMIAMSTHGRTGLARWVFGSVAEKVVRASPVPVMLIRSFDGESRAAAPPVDGRELTLRRILVPTDGSPLSLGVIPYAEELAWLFRAEVVALHAKAEARMPVGSFHGTLIDPGGVPLAPAAPETAEDPAVSAAESFASRGIRATTLTVPGDPAEAILEAGRAHGIDLIAMATHGRSGISRWLLGSVAERVLRASTLPMLLARTAPGGACTDERR
jgi:nucleotide-binding universal stress UspA family protein